MSNPEQELVELERSWLEAVQRDDYAALERIVGKEYAYAATGQGRHTRESWMATVPDYVVHDFKIGSTDARVYGDAAVVLLDVHLSATVHGAPRQGDFIITDTWIKRDGRWQVVARSSILTPTAR